jgi:5'(3')-deoxyribonucleotidase
MKFSRVVLVDMDDVVAGFYTEAYKRIQKLDKNINAHKKSSSYFFEEEYPKYTQEIRDIFHSVGFFANLPIIEGSLEGWQKLLDNGYDPVFCSSPLLTSPY